MTRGGDNDIRRSFVICSTLPAGQATCLVKCNGLQTCVFCMGVKLGRLHSGRNVG